MRHLMLDLETGGTKVGCSVLSIGMLFFDPVSKEKGREFLAYPDLFEQHDSGLVLDPGTISWWVSQSKEARKDAFKKSERYRSDQIYKFILNYINKEVFNSRDCFLWANGAGFDIPILNEYFVKTCKKELPIPFWNHRDVRTIKSLYPDNLFDEWKENNPRKGAHNALADCHYQVDYIQHICSELGIKEFY